jgi:hypothetical protein
MMDELSPAQYGKLPHYVVDPIWCCENPHCPHHEIVGFSGVALTEPDDVGLVIEVAAPEGYRAIAMRRVSFQYVAQRYSGFLNSLL